MKLKPCTKSEFDAFLVAYPRKLDRDVNRMCEPPLVSYNDFTQGEWPASIVASHSFVSPHSHEQTRWQIAEHVIQSESENDAKA